MKKFPRRDRMKIYGDLLFALRDAKQQEGKIVPTRIQRKVNVPFDRLKGYISELKELNLIENETSLVLTEKGQEYVSEYQKVLDFMKRMGLTY